MSMATHCVADEATHAAPGGFAFVRLVLAAAVLSGSVVVSSTPASAGALHHSTIAPTRNLAPSPKVATSSFRTVTGGTLLDKPTFGEKFMLRLNKATRGTQRVHR